VKSAFATSPPAAVAQVPAARGGVQRPPLALLMLGAFLIGAGLAWKLLAPIRAGGRSQVD
jgi:hypothetical protein